MMSLAMAGENENLKIVQVWHGGKFKKKLSEMGLYKDSQIKVIKNDIPGPLIVDVKGSRLIIGRGQAQKIMVEGS
ncbi:FeoA family protein [Methanobacterium sp.]|uniref:FeoA family protein n=1 Tax=Methanobacterium sp. TaxID=2164 RepID=UPI0025EA8772|nr:FeoA family protein [Methanobacterium sp.]